MIKSPITLACGNGGKLTHEIISSVFVPAFNNPELNELADSACVSVAGQRIAFTTDSHVISPIFFPGGDIGKLAVAGTINDLAVVGAQPLFLSCGFIIEEGFGVDNLQKIVQSMADTAGEAGVHIVTGDTKVVEKGAADGIFINTAGIGLLSKAAPKGIRSIQAGDAVILSGSLGDHGVAIYAEREKLLLKNPLNSDCASILSLAEKAMQVCDSIRIMRDPTRGGLATTLNEIVSAQTFGMEIVEDDIPVKEPVRAVCEMLGFDPLYMPNEGKVVMVVPEKSAETVINAIKTDPLGRMATIIGRVTDQYPGRLSMRTFVGGERIIDMLIDDPFPRIC
jgi:hydrogenase expression/formation protein HypE